MKLSRDVLKYLLIDQAVIPFVINVVVNVILVWLTFGGQAAVSTWSPDRGAAADFVGTCFILPWLTCLIATPIVRYQARHGITQSIRLADLPVWLRILRAPLLLRALYFGLAGFVLLAGPVLAVLGCFADEAISFWQFLIMKALFAGVFGFLVTPLIALTAMTDNEPAEMDTSAV